MFRRFRPYILHTIIGKPVNNKKSDINEFCTNSFISSKETSPKGGTLTFMKFLAFFVQFLFLCTFSNAQEPPGQKDNAYYNNDLGWTIKPPQGYVLSEGSERKVIGEAAAGKLGKKYVENGTTFLLSFKRVNGGMVAIFMSGLQSIRDIGAPIKNEDDFITFLAANVKKSSPDVKFYSFDKTISNARFRGYYYFNPVTKINQKGLLKIVRGKIFYQTWIYSQESDGSNIEDAVFSAKFDSNKFNTNK